MIWSKERREGVKSTFYNFLYALLLLVIVFYFGPDIYTTEGTKLVIFVFYVICLWVLGKIFKKLN
ncbi:MAG: hypothetical protein V4469_02510 [Patescibacteria group bacterium]